MKKAAILSFSLIFLTFILSSCGSKNLVMQADYGQPQLQVEQLPDSQNSSFFGFGAPKKPRVKVALLLPLSGKHKDLGKSLLNAATLSVFENDGDNTIELVIFDTKDNQYGATEAMKEVASRGIKLVIGPVFSNSIDAVSETVKNNGIVALSLSNNMELANNPGIFLMGFFPEQQIEKITSYSISRGKNNFSIIAPNNQYGVKVADIFKETVRKKDGNFIASEFYLNNNDLERAAGRAVKAFRVPDRLMEEKKKKDDKPYELKEEDKIYSDVILIPDSGKSLSKIVAAIKNSNTAERPIQIIGTSSWDEISTLNDENLIGSWFAAPDFRDYRDYEKRYYQAYGEFPVRISSISYDAVNVLIKLANKIDDRSLIFKDFIDYDGFKGIDGDFRFLPNGITQRNLAVLEVGNARFDIIESPSIFLKY